MDYQALLYGLIMKKLGFILILVWFSTNVFGQSKCVCVDYNEKQVKPDTIFNLGEKSLAICNGYFENGFVAEFSIKSCNDTSIDKFYDATLEYKLEAVKDTLYLQDHRFLWNPETQKFEKPIWAIEKFWVENNEFKYDRIVVYQVDRTLKLDNDFKNEWEFEVKDDWSDNPKLISWTFQLSLMNQEIYEKYFKHFRDTFQIGGANAEYYNELNRMYKEKIKN